MGNRAGFRRSAALLAIIFALIAMGRILETYHRTAQTFDEPCHVAAAIEYLAKGKYTLDPVHPPLSRIAIGLPLYFAGVRYPQLPESDPGSRNYNVVGNAILYGDGHYLRNLFLARTGVLPFFLLATAVVFFWTKYEFGETAAVLAVFVFTTLPATLAFSSIAYSDMVAASTQSLACFAFANWLRTFHAKSTVWLGVALGLAALSKFTTFLFLLSACFCMTAIWLLLANREEKLAQKLRRRGVHFLAACAIAAILLWAGYRFSVGHVQETIGITPQNMPSFQHFPAPMRRVAETLIVKDAVIPAPELVRGLAGAWVLNKTFSESYLFGPIYGPGPWYFFFLVVALKLPIPTILLSAAGVIALMQCFRERRWSAIMPAAALVGIFLITLPVSYKVGSRHLLVAFPLLSILAGGGGAYLLKRLQHRKVGILCVGALLVSQTAISMTAQADPLSYFNLFAGRDPSKIVVMGCDLDCGQDLFRLADALRRRHVDHFKLAIWSSADMSKSGLPPFDVMPIGRQTGWIAVSLRALRMGDVLHESYPPGALDWLNRYEPVAYVGKTIRLYHIEPE